MGLKTKENTNPLAEKGIFISKAKITKATITDGSEYTTWKPDIAVKITFDVGASFEPVDTIAGSFKKDISGEVIDWGSAFKVADFFKIALGNPDLELTEDNSIPEEWLSQIIGTEIYRLTYVYGFNADTNKGKYKPWDLYNKNPEKLIEAFHKSVAKGYPKDYNPEVLETTNVNMFTDENDLPF